jgi:hypothetical protein
MQLLFKFKGLLLKPKPKIIFLNFCFEFFNIHISHLTLHSMINMSLKWHHKNISNKIIIFIKFWRSPNMLFGLFDYDCTQLLNHNEKIYPKTIVRMSNHKTGLRSIIWISIPNFSIFTTCERITVHTTHLEAQQ